MEFGVGGHDDYPVTRYGSGTDRPFYLLRGIGPANEDLGAWSLPAGPDRCPANEASNDLGEITGSPNGRGDLEEAMEGLPCHGGGDMWESGTVALWATATGMGLDWPEGGSLPGRSCPTIPDEFEPRRGYPCFRPGALPIIMLFGDAGFHNAPDDGSPYPFDAPTFDAAVVELNGIGARVMSIYSGLLPSPFHADFERFATDTGAVRPDGTPLTFDIESDGTGLGATVVDAVVELVRGTPQDVSTRVENVAGNPDDFDATRFIKSVVALEGYADGIAGMGYSHKDDASFFGVIPGTVVEFTVDFHNDVRMPASVAQIFRARIIVMGNGVAELDARNVYIIVPPDGSVILI